MNKKLKNFSKTSRKHLFLINALLFMITIILFFGGDFISKIFLFNNNLKVSPSDNIYILPESSSSFNFISVNSSLVIPSWIFDLGITSGGNSSILMYTLSFSFVLLFFIIITFLSRNKTITILLSIITAGILANAIDYLFISNGAGIKYEHKNSIFQHYVRTIFIVNNLKFNLADVFIVGGGIIFTIYMVTYGIVKQVKHSKIKKTVSVQKNKSHK